MPYSHKTGKQEILNWFIENQKIINRVIDIGAGSGTYSMLLKDQISSEIEWVGVEIWQEYIERFKLASLYDTIVNDDARKINWGNLGKFSVAIAGDVLEHMTKQEAENLVNETLEHCDMMIISIPIVYMPQDEAEGNPHEVHVKPDWSHTEVLDTWGSYIKKYSVKSKKSKIGVYWLAK